MTRPPLTIGPAINKPPTARERATCKYLNVQCLRKKTAIEARNDVFNLCRCSVYSASKFTWKVEFKYVEQNNVLELIAVFNISRCSSRWVPMDFTNKSNFHERAEKVFELFNSSTLEIYPILMSGWSKSKALLVTISWNKLSFQHCHVVECRVSLLTCTTNYELTKAKIHITLKCISITFFALYMGKNKNESDELHFKLHIFYNVYEKGFKWKWWTLFQTTYILQCIWERIKMKVMNFISNYIYFAMYMRKN